MAPALPLSLSPHICILSSPDLDELLNASSLPPLPELLQSFSPLPQVTTRTTTLTPVPHTSFALRFSDLGEIEAGCREDEEQRAARTIDWISARISARCSKWLEDWEKSGAAAAEKERQAEARTPWWDELKRCVEGDHVPSRAEGWNHPVAIVLAVSTTAPNPLQSLAQLHSRPPEFPPWVDNTYLRYTLIIHPKNSPLSDEEAGALFNAAKKQYGLQTYLLPLALPSPPPPPVPVPMLPPRLPVQVPDFFSSPDPSARAKTPIPGTTVGPAQTINTLRMSEQDIQQTARFVREFVAMNLVPWMEKCVLDWNENFSSTRRLPSRLFSSTRRLFGSSASPAPTHGPNASVSSISSRTHNSVGSQSSVSSISGPNGPPSQQRRLAEFATVLGDFKLATSVWEALRKDGKGGSDVLPFLLSPSPALQLHAMNALSALRSSNMDLTALAQLRAVLYAVRWENSISPLDFLSNVLEGDRWLVWAASSAEEPPSALLLAHAAYLSVRRQAPRRASLWYLFAANKLEKSGIRPLTTYFLQRAHDLYKSSPEKSLSPQFWESEGIAPNTQAGFEAILPGIEHALGRLHYTTGDIKGAVQLFLGLLHGSLSAAQPSLSFGAQNGYPVEIPKSMVSDKVFLEDFRVAFQHFLDTSEDRHDIAGMKLPVTFCIPKATRVRLPGDSVGGSQNIWEAREDTWRTFWKNHGKEGLRGSGTAPVNEHFWVELSLHNPLDVEVNLSNLTLVVQDSQSSDTSMDFLEVEVVDDIILSPKESRTIPLSVKAKRPATLLITHASYDFLSLLHTNELQETPLQRQSKMYAPDVLIKVQVEDARQRMAVNFVDDDRLMLAHGECRVMRIWLSNLGTGPIDEVWLVSGPEDELYVHDDADYPEPANLSTEVIHSDNSLASRPPYQVMLKHHHSEPSLAPQAHFEFSMTLHAEVLGDQELCLIFVYREKGSQTFNAARVTRCFEVRPLLSVSTIFEPSRTLDHLFLLNTEISNVSIWNDVVIQQLTTLSPTWQCTPVTQCNIGALLPSQNLRIPFGVSPWGDRKGAEETLQFVLDKLQAVLRGEDIGSSKPPPIDILCSYLPETTMKSLALPDTACLVRQSRRNRAARSLAEAHPDIPPESHPSIFPLYNPAIVEIVLFWSIPSEHRTGHISISAATLGARHGALDAILDEAADAKVKRNMFAETQREKDAILNAIRASEWNAEMDPVVITSQNMKIVEHDFSSGPCHVSVEFTVKNYSLTHSCKYTLAFPSDPLLESATGVLARPSYAGRLTYRGVLRPQQHATVQPTLHASRPDTYALGGWRLETDVYDPSPPSGPGSRTRRRYVQGPASEDQSCVTVVDVSPL
ncbi:hypothetical protein DENSPDRAFT_856966 [Dentipellis sp. KUC8613]|nr:hypothetical protein DENSPDRAFT_856966 [Dentipellis sp. KUC8613]